MPEVLAPFAAFTLVLWVVALCLAIGYIVGWIAGVFSPIPVVGGRIAGAMKSVGKAITNAGIFLITNLEGIVGAAFHWMARYLELTWNTIVTESYLGHLVANLLHRFAVAIRSAANAAHHAASVVLGHAGVLRRLEREIHGIDRELKTLERQLGNGIGNDVLPRIKSLERELGKVEGQIIPGIQAGEVALQNDITKLGEWIRANFVSTATDAISAAVAVGLAALGLGGLRCNSNPFKNNPNACGLWSDLARFLPLLGLLGLAFDFPEFVAAAEIVAGDIGSAVASIEGVFPLTLDPLPPPN